MDIYESAEYPMAMEVNIVNYLRDNGYELRREGNNYAVITHDTSGKARSFIMLYSWGKKTRQERLNMHL